MEKALPVILVFGGFSLLVIIMVIILIFALKPKKSLPLSVAPFPPAPPGPTPPTASPLWPEYQSNAYPIGYTNITPFDTTASSAANCAAIIQSAVNNANANDNTVVGWSYVVTPSGTSCRAADTTNMKNACIGQVPSGQSAYINQTVIDYYNMKTCT